MELNFNMYSFYVYIEQSALVVAFLAIFGTPMIFAPIALIEYLLVKTNLQTKKQLENNAILTNLKTSLTLTTLSSLIVMLILFGLLLPESKHMHGIKFLLIWIILFFTSLSFSIVSHEDLK